jgi:hypothetical protein
MHWSERIVVSALMLASCGCAASLKGYRPVEIGGVYFLAEEGRDRPRDQERKIGEVLPLLAPDGAIADDSETAAAIMETYKDKLTTAQYRAAEFECPARKADRISRHYLAALKAFDASDDSRALAEFDAAQRVCSTIGSVSAINFYRGRIYARTQRVDEARKAFGEFLRTAWTPYPLTFGEVMPLRGETSASLERELREKRNIARGFLDTAESDKQIQYEYRPSAPILTPNNQFRLGGTRDMYPLLVPLLGVGYSSYSGGIWQLGVVWFKPIGRTVIIPFLSSGSRFGDFYGLSVRYAFYESDNRDLNIEVNATIRTIKSIVTIVDDGGIRDVYVDKEGVESSFGLGGTYRWSNALGVSAGFLTSRDSLADRGRLTGTLLPFYEVWDGVSLYAGYDADRPVVGLQALFAKAGYDFKERDIFAGLVIGF